MDIVMKPKKTGFLANSLESYADALDDILSLSPANLLKIQKESRRFVVDRFSEKEFANHFIECFTGR